MFAFLNAVGLIGFVLVFRIKYDTHGLFCLTDFSENK